MNEPKKTKSSNKRNVICPDNINEFINKQINRKIFQNQEWMNFMQKTGKIGQYKDMFHKQTVNQSNLNKFRTKCDDTAGNLFIPDKTGDNVFNGDSSKNIGNTWNYANMASNPVVKQINSSMTAPKQSKIDKSNNQKLNINMSSMGVKVKHRLNLTNPDDDLQRKDSTNTKVDEYFKGHYQLFDSYTKIETFGNTQSATNSKNTNTPDNCQTLIQSKQKDDDMVVRIETGVHEEESDHNINKGAFSAEKEKEIRSKQHSALRKFTMTDHSESDDTPISPDIVSGKTTVFNYKSRQNQNSKVVAPFYPDGSKKSVFTRNSTAINSFNDKFSEKNLDAGNFDAKHVITEEDVESINTSSDCESEFQS